MYQAANFKYIIIGTIFVIGGVLIFFYFKKDFKMDYAHIKGYGLSASLVTGGLMLIIAILLDYF
jgi:hypothetical protein